MRYTTCIDITEYDAVYRNKNARLLYLHLCLKSGYRNEDRDKVNMSVRAMAWQTGISLSACRHALDLLIRNNLLQHEGGSAWTVTKFVQPEIITKRPTIDKKREAESAYQAAEERRRLQDELSKLRRWYTDFMQRGDEQGARDVQKQAAKIQKRLKELPE